MRQQISASTLSKAIPQRKSKFDLRCGIRTLTAALKKRRIALIGQGLPYGFTLTFMKNVDCVTSFGPDVNFASQFSG